MMEEPRLRKARAEFFAFVRGVEAAAREYREEGFRGWMWALRTLGVDPPSRRSSTIEGAVFLDGVRRKRQRALLALDPVGLRRARFLRGGRDAPDAYWRRRHGPRPRWGQAARWGGRGRRCVSALQLLELSVARLEDMRAAA